MPVDVTVVDRRNHHTFQPLLYQVALAVLSPADIAQPIRSILRHQRNTEVLMDEVVGIDIAARQVALASGARLAYDYLVLATGATHSYFGHDEWEPLAPGLKTIEDAIEIRRRVLLAFELAERQMVEQGWHPPLNFVVIGGGPTGVELAGAISDIAQLYMRHDFRHIDPTKSRVLLLDGGAARAGRLSRRISPPRPKPTLKRLGVEVHTKTQVTGVGPGWVEAERHSACEAAVTLWAAGVQASPLGKMLGAPPKSARPPRLRPRRRPPQPARPARGLRPRRPGPLRAGRPPGPRRGPARHADGRPRRQNDRRRPRRPSRAPPSATSTRATWPPSAAWPPSPKSKWPFKAHMSGFPAWFTWLTVHIFFLIGFRNRISVLTNWIWTYFTFTRGARLITGDQNLPGWKDQPRGGAAEHERTS